MPPKRLHEQFDNDTGEGTSNIKKIQIVRGADSESENDSDEGVKKIRIVRAGDNDDEGIMCEDCSQGFLQLREYGCVVSTSET